MEEERWALDRIEGDWAVLIPPQGGERQVPRTQLAAGAAEGMLLVFDAAQGLYRPDAEATAARQAEMKARVAALLAKHGER